MSQTMVLGSGCFWCTQAQFDHIRGVISTSVGYAGGNEVNPTYEQVSAHATGHAEVTKVDFDPAIISLEQILEIFFLSHDPTTPNRQGADVGQQYRSCIYYTDNAQRDTALRVKKEIEDEHIYSNPIVTEIAPLTTYYEGEDYHQKYFDKNPNEGYCSIVINPKVKKLKVKFADLFIEK